MVLWGTLIAYLAIMVGIGIYCRKKTSNVDDFVLGGRSIGPWFTAFAYGTSYFSAVVFVGYAGQFGWEYGLASTWIGLGNAFIGSLLAWFLLGKRTRIMSKYLQTSTMPEFFEKRYLSKPLKLSSAIIIFIFLIPYTASVYNGLSRLFETAFHIPYSACIVAMALFTAIYVILGGYHATALNDFVQGIIMLIGIASVVVCVLAHKGGLTEAVSSLSQIPDNSGNTGTYTSLLGPDPINLFGVVILTSLGTWGLPQMVQKFYAIKSGPAVKQGAIISTLFAFVVAGGGVHGTFLHCVQRGARPDHGYERGLFGGVAGGVCAASVVAGEPQALSGGVPAVSGRRGGGAVPAVRQRRHVDVRAGRGAGVAVVGGACRRAGVRRARPGKP